MSANRSKWHCNNSQLKWKLTTTKSLPVSNCMQGETQTSFMWHEEYQTEPNTHFAVKNGPKCSLQSGRNAKGLVQFRGAPQTSNRRRLSSFCREEERIGGGGEKVIDRAKSCRPCHPIPSTQNHSGWHQYATEWKALTLSRHNHVKRKIFPKSFWSPNPNGVQEIQGIGTSVSLTACTKAANPWLHPWNRLLATET